MAKQNPEQIFQSPQAAKLLGDKALVDRLVHSQDAQALMSMLERSSRGGLKAAAEAAMKGDASQLQGLLTQLMKDPAGAQIVERINHSAQGK